MLKKQRNYRAVFEIGERKDGKRYPTDELVIKPPFTVMFETDTGINNTSSNKAILQFINLSEDNKTLLWLDVWNRTRKYVHLDLYAGYGDNMPLIFSGYLFSCTSYKVGGSTEFITEMVSQTGHHLLRYGYLNATFVKGTRLADIVKIATNDGEFGHVGYITPDISPLKRDKTFIGQPLDLIQREYNGYNIFVTNEEINILGDRDVVPGEVQVLSDKSGLLGSPRRGTGYIECDIIFEPQLKAGQAVILNSTTLPWMNRAYKITKVAHKVTISPNVCERAVTTVTMNLAYKGENELRELKKETESSYTAPPTKGAWAKPVLNGKITSVYGDRIHPIFKKKIFHDGIDIGANMNDFVYAPANGKVLYTYINGGYGNYVEIDHGEINGVRVVSFYGHLNKWIVSPGEIVTQGQQIGYVGSTGYSTGPHLHFGIKENGKSANPTKYIGTF